MVFAIYQIMLGSKTYEDYYETDELPNPRKIRLRPTIMGFFFSPYFWSFQRSPKPRNQNHLQVLWDRKSSLFFISVPGGGEHKRILSELALVLSGLCSF